MDSSQCEADDEESLSDRFESVHHLWRRFKHVIGHLWCCMILFVVGKSIRKINRCWFYPWAPLRRQWATRTRCTALLCGQSSTIDWGTVWLNRGLLILANLFSEPRLGWFFNEWASGRVNLCSLRGAKQWYSGSIISKNSKLRDKEN